MLLYDCDEDIGKSRSVEETACESKAAVRIAYYGQSATVQLERNRRINEGIKRIGMAYDEPHRQRAARDLYGR